MSTALEVSQQATATMSSSAGLPTSSSTSSNSSSSGGNGSFFGTSFSSSAPSTVLFFLALAVGILIALLFLFFTLRYFVRLRYGLQMYPLAGARGQLYTPHSPLAMFAASNFASTHDTRHDNEAESESQESGGTLLDRRNRTDTENTQDNPVTQADANADRNADRNADTNADGNADGITNGNTDRDTEATNRANGPNTSTDSRNHANTNQVGHTSGRTESGVGVDHTPLEAFGDLPASIFSFGPVGDQLEHRLLVIHRSSERFARIHRNREAYLYGGRERRRRNRRRYARMKRLTQEQVDELFPQKTYHDWLNGGKERDAEEREGILEEESKGNMLGELLSEVPTKGGTSTEIEMTALETHSSNDSQLAGENKLGEVMEEELHFTSGSCAICLEQIEEDEVVRGLVCGHVFHAECLDPWLIRRRACCPMCKRDYFMNAVPENPEANEDANENEDVYVEQIDTNDYLLVRNDTVLRSLLQELVPLEERVRLVVSDEQLRPLRIEERAEEWARRTYGRFLKVVWWHLMGITKTNLYNFAVMKFYNEFDERRLENYRRGRRDTGNGGEDPVLEETAREVTEQRV